MTKTELLIDEARMLYANGNAATKTWLEGKFEKAELTKSFRDQFNAWEDFCAYSSAKLNINPELPYASPANGMDRFLNATKKVAIMSIVLRQGRKHNWTDKNERKVRPYYDMSSGFGLSYYGCVNVDPGTIVGSRLCFGEYEDFKYLFDKFPDVFEDLMLERD